MTYGKADQNWLCRIFTWRENERVSVVKWYTSWASIGKYPLKEARERKEQMRARFLGLVPDVDGQRQATFAEVWQEWRRSTSSCV
jgi:hypothetical protein